MTKLRLGNIALSAKSFIEHTQENPKTGHDDIQYEVHFTTTSEKRLESIKTMINKGPVPLSVDDDEPFPVIIVDIEYTKKGADYQVQMQLRRWLDGTIMALSGEEIAQVIVGDHVMLSALVRQLIERGLVDQEELEDGMREYARLHGWDPIDDDDDEPEPEPPVKPGRPRLNLIK